jgi:hypothetical protein
MKRNGVKESEIPAGRKDGPSGHPMLHFVNHSSRKEAREAAKRGGKGNNPVHDQPNDVGQLPHFHTTYKNGERRNDGVHHLYPRKHRAKLIEEIKKKNKQERSEKAMQAKENRRP